MRGRMRLLGVAGALFALALVAAACSSAGASTGGGMTLKISSPTNGASVSEPFKVTFDSSVPLGKPTTGDHHVHLCFDGGSCDELSQSVIAYGNSVMVSNLSPGMHTIEASLRNADHSDTGVSATISVDVSGGSAGSQAGSQSGSSTGASGPSKGYGY
ncbi:MAG TPA: hypothetical protein VKC55_03010 [Actinomycetota bacterium]|nr:hypothetical protein [Actinomycetota bacterium]